MSAKILGLLSFLFLLFGSVSAQSEQLEIDRGNEIIKLARLSIYKNIKKDNVKSIQVKTSVDTLTESIKKIEGQKDSNRQSRNISENETSIIMPNFIKTVLVSYNNKDNPTENYSKAEGIFNGNDYSNSMDIIRNGKKIDLSAFFTNLPSSVPDSIKKQAIGVLDNKIDRATYIQELWVNMFPLLLDTPWDNSVSFLYVGKAQAGEIKADVLQVKADFNNDIRLFFDEKSHLLLIMTIQKKWGENSLETETYYFSKYELFDGVLIARKINIKSSNVDKTKIINEGLPTLLGSETKTTSEILIKEFKVNPTFKPNFFEIKKK